ncbi:hypothetical protein D3C72_1277090 [compost metagenome]
MRRSLRVALILAWALFSLVALSLTQGSLSLTPTPSGRWIITHVINPENNESQEVLEYLKERKATYQYDELIVFTQNISRELEEKLKAMGFIVHYRKEAELQLEETNLKPPFFLLTSPRGEGAFAGPYGKPINDLGIAKSFFSSQAMRYFPMAGCGVSVRIQKRIDPQRTLMSLVGYSKAQ